MRGIVRLVGSLVGLLLLGSVAMAGVTFDAPSGQGFVGKGDVQSAFGWNNKLLQDNASQVRFRVAAEVAEEVTWTCTNSNNDTVQERARTTTTTVQGALVSLARERQQVTGFLLTGYADDSTIAGSTTGGPPLNSCPSGPWSLTDPAGDPVVVSSSEAFQVSIDGETWVDLPQDGPAES